MKENQLFIKNENNQSEVKRYPKTIRTIGKPKVNLPDCPNCRQNIWVELTHSYYCPGYDFDINKHEHQIDNKVLRQDKNFSTRLPYGKKRLAKFIIQGSIQNVKKTEDMIGITQS